eukprot:gene5922-9752_t
MANHQRYCTLKIDPDYFKKVSPNFRDDEEISILVVKQKPRLLFSCGSSARSNPKVVEAAIELDPSTIQFASDALQDDEHFILKNAKILGKNIMFCYNFKRDEEMMLKLVKENPECFEGADKYLYYNKEFKERVRSIIIENEKEFVESKLHSIQKNDKNGYSIEEQIKYLVESNFYEYLDKEEKFDFESTVYHRDDKYCIKDELIFEDPLLLKFSSQEMKEDKNTVKLLLEKNPLCLKYASEEIRDNDEIVKRVLENLSKIFQHFKNNFNMNLEYSLFLEHNNVFKFLSERLKSQKNIILLAMESNGMMLKHVPPKFQNDTEIVTIAKKCKGSLEFVPEELKGNSNIVKIALKENPENFKYLINDSQTSSIKEILKSNGNLLQYCSEVVKNDRDIDDIEIIDIAIQKNPFSLFNLSKENQENEKFALQSLKKDYKVYDFLPEQMKQEKDFLLEILKFRHIPISKIPKNLRFDHDILLLIVKSNLIIEHHHYLNLDFLKQAIQSNQGSLIFAPLDMQNDKKFILNLVKNSKSMIKKYCGF